MQNPLLKRFKTEKLIEIYEKFPELWHKGERSVKKSETQAKAYCSISQKLKQFGINLKAATVQQRLVALRKRYRLEKFEELKAHLNGQIYESSFEFYAHLQFLREHIEPQLCKICRRICKDTMECCEGVEKTRNEKNETVIPTSNEVEESGDAVAEGQKENEVLCAAKEPKQEEESMEVSNQFHNIVDEMTLKASKSVADEFEIMVGEILKSVDTMQETKLEASVLEIKSKELESVVDTTNKLHEGITPMEQSKTPLEEPMLQENLKVDGNPNLHLLESRVLRRSLRNRNKINILEVIELRRAVNSSNDVLTVKWAFMKYFAAFSETFYDTRARS